MCIDFDGLADAKLFKNGRLALFLYLISYILYLMVLSKLGVFLATLEQKIQELIQDSVAALDCEIVGIECQRSGRFLTVRIYIDKQDGVGVDDCADVSREVSAIMDVEDLIADKYNLEVSSPGLNRPLFTLAHYQRFIGQDVVIHLRVPVLDRCKWSGKLEHVEGDMITLSVDSCQQAFAFGNIQKGNIIYQFEN